MSASDKEEFLDAVTEEGASIENRVKFIDKGGYRSDAVCRLETGKVSKAFLMKSGGEEISISSCVKEVELFLGNQGEEVSVVSEGVVISSRPEVQSLNEKIDFCAKRAKAHFNPNDPEEYNVFGDAENTFVSKCMLELY